MSKFELVKTGGPYGDSTSTYDVVTDAETVGELIDTLLGKDNYATFNIRRKEGISGDDVCVAYANGGKITRKSSQYDDYAGLKLKKAMVNGGWGSMNYDFWVEGELPHQDREEFQTVYWGRVF